MTRNGSGSDSSLKAMHAREDSNTQRPSKHSRRRWSMTEQCDVVSDSGRIRSLPQIMRKFCGSAMNDSRTDDVLKSNRLKYLYCFISGR